LWARDKGCRFPGCGRTRYVEAHHCLHWSSGGETSLANTMLLCSKHHTLHHEGGFTIEKDYRGRWFFRNADGRAVPACGYRPEDITDETAGTADEYFGRRVSACMDSSPFATIPDVRRRFDCSRVSGL
jgi:HNH endonuclease